MGRLAAVFEIMIKAAPVRMWALILAGPAITLINCGLILIIWLGGWAPLLAHDQLHYLGFLALTYAGIVGVIVVTLAAAKASARGPGGTGFEIESGQDAQSQGSKITVTAETKP